MDENKGKRIQDSLRDSSYETKRFSGSIILLLLYSLAPVHLDDLGKGKKEVWEDLHGKDNNFHFDFGDDHDPHCPRGLTLEKVLLNFQELSLVARIPEKYFLTNKGCTYLFNNLVFMAEFVDKIETGYGWPFVIKYLKQRKVIES